jgi:hypothetical protein
LLSLNIRGIGGTLKDASFYHLMEQMRPEIVFLQETLAPAQKAMDLFFCFRPTWAICSVNVVGTFGGLLVAWDPSSLDLTLFLSVGGILLIGFILADNKELTLLNVYGPCSARKSLWTNVKYSSILFANNLILASDFNIILDSYET